MSTIGVIATRASDHIKQHHQEIAEQSRTPCNAEAPALALTPQEMVSAR